MPGSREYKAAWAKAKRARLTPSEREERQTRNRLWMRKQQRERGEHVRALARNRYNKNRDVISRKRATPEARAKAARYARERAGRDLIFRLVKNLRSRIRKAIFRKGGARLGTFRLLGCTVYFLKRWIEAQFEPGMSWANRSEWHIDHIRPCASFDLADPEQQKRCFHFTNLRPLWKAENLKKSDTWAESFSV